MPKWLLRCGMNLADWSEDMLWKSEDMLWKNACPVMTEKSMGPHSLSIVYGS